MSPKKPRPSPSKSGKKPAAEPQPVNLDTQFAKTTQAASSKKPTPAAAPTPATPTRRRFGPAVLVLGLLMLLLAAILAQPASTAVGGAAGC